jgi:homocitrate synthase NifV
MIHLVDTTLRDGHQAPGLALSLETRETVIKALDDLGVARIEAVSIGMSPVESIASKRWRGLMKRSKLVAWNRLKLSDVEGSMAIKPDVIHVCFSASESHLSKKLNMTFEKAANVLEKCLDLAHLNGFEVSVGLEDASRAGFERLSKIRSLLRYLKVGHVRLSDTCGVLTPSTTRQLVEFFATGHFSVEFHAHNDLGMANVNALIAAQSGADFINTSILGVGERTGNASFSGFLALAERCRALAVNVSSAQAMALERTLREFLSREGYMASLKSSPGSDVTDWLAHHAGLQRVNR